MKPAFTYDTPLRPYRPPGPCKHRWVDGAPEDCPELIGWMETCKDCGFDRPGPKQQEMK
jgi:hypothetical protein